MKFSIFHQPKADHPLLAIVLLMVAVLVLACQDSLVKLMSSQTSFWQFQTLRSFLNLVIAAGLAMLSGGLILLRPNNWRGVYLRAGFLTICMFFFFAGAPSLSIAQMAAGLFTYPIFVSILARPVLGEIVGPWRIGALTLGSVGAAIVLGPWREDFSAVQLMPLVAGFFYACNILTLRKACRRESPLAMVFAVGLVFIVSGLLGIFFMTFFPPALELRQSAPFVFIGWPELTWIVLGFAGLTSILNLTGNICLTRAYQTADASMLAPLDFIYLLFAAIWGRVLFGQWPSDEAAFGMALIACSGILIAWREQISARRRRVVTP
ncbi:MAG: drug/metabolite transporter (DMT)-like permease [Parasphingorhabdus sp.]|jgi:drug/metabolite transporter (DMT)-like permease